MSSLDEGYPRTLLNTYINYCLTLEDKIWLTVTKYPYLKWQWIFSFLKTKHMSIMHPTKSPRVNSRAHEGLDLRLLITPLVSSHFWSLYCLSLDLWLLITSLWYLHTFGHGIVCPSIYGFWIPHWYLHTFGHCIVCP
jgi:hypothetical protein